MSAAFGWEAAGALLASLPPVAAVPNLNPEGKKSFGNWIFFSSPMSTPAISPSSVPSSPPSSSSESQAEILPDFPCVREVFTIPWRREERAREFEDDEASAVRTWNLLLDRAGACPDGSAASAGSVACRVSGCASSSSSSSSSICSSTGWGEGLFAFPLFDRLAGEFAAGAPFNGVFLPAAFDERVGGGGVIVHSLFARAMPLVTRRGGLGSRSSSSSPCVFSPASS